MMLLLPLALAFSCATPGHLVGTVEAEGGIQPVAEAALQPAGELQNGLWEDGSRNFSLRVPEGWVAEPGSQDSPLRLVLKQIATGTLLQVWAFPAGDLSPRPRANCSWEFVDMGHYDYVRTSRPITVATCVPRDPAGVAVLGVYFDDGGTAWHLETLIPPGRLLEGRRGASEILRSLELHGPR